MNNVQLIMFRNVRMLGFTNNMTVTTITHPTVYILTHEQVFPELVIDCQIAVIHKRVERGLERLCANVTHDVMKTNIGISGIGLCMWDGLDGPINGAQTYGGEYIRPIF